MRATPHGGGGNDPTWPVPKAEAEGLTLLKAKSETE